MTRVQERLTKQEALEHDVFHNGACVVWHKYGAVKTFPGRVRMFELRLISGGAVALVTYYNAGWWHVAGRCPGRGA